jgi:hypothetical protein
VGKPWDDENISLRVFDDDDGGISIDKKLFFFGKKKPEY